MTLRTRFGLWLFVAMAIVAGLLLAYYQSRINDLQTREGDARINTLSRHLAASSVLAVLTGNADLVNAPLRAALDEPDVVAVSVVDAGGKLVAREARDGFAPPALEADAQACAACVLGRRHLRWVVPVERTGAQADPDEAEDLYDAPPEASAEVAQIGWVVVDISTRERIAARNRLLFNAALLALLVLVIAVIVTLVGSRRLSGSLLELGAATREIGRGKWDVPVPKNATGEIRALADDFEAMALALAALDAETRQYRENLEQMVESRTEELQQAHDRMKQLLESKDQFVRTVSHDFRSPLAVILSSVQTVLRDPEMTPKVRERFLRRAEEQSKRLEALVSDLLDLARLEQTDGPLPTEALDPCLAEIVATHRTDCAEAGIELVYTAEGIEDLSLPLDPPLLALALGNLIGNARKFTPAGGRIELAAGVQGDRATVRVKDDGPGISKEEAERIFEPFFQGSDGAPRGGFGLGLSIVRGVAQRHGGTVELQSDHGGGACFELSLPLTNSSQGVGEDGHDSDRR